MTDRKADAENRNNINTQDLKEDNLKVENFGTADPAGADKSENAAAVPAKFKDVQTLYKAYSALEAEFTRRSQRLKELEKENKAQTPSDGTDKASSQLSEDKLAEIALSNENVRKAVIEEYLKGVVAQKGVPLTGGGGGIAAPRTTPKTVKEAGRLAREFLNK